MKKLFRTGIYLPWENFINDFLKDYKVIIDTYDYANRSIIIQ